jgi:hypothetical protein
MCEKNQSQNHTPRCGFILKNSFSFLDLKAFLTN